MTKFSNQLKFLQYFLMILLLTAFVAGCGNWDGSRGGSPSDAIDTTAPTVTATAPVNAATDVPINTKIITAAFSKAMDPATLTPASFTLAQGNPAVPVPGGTVTYVATGDVATLTLPAADLLPSTLYTATITTAAMDESANALANDFIWTFTTGETTDTTPPTVTATSVYGTTGVTSGATGLFVNRSSTATFSEPMNALSITTPPAFTVVTVVNDQEIAVAGTVTYSVAAQTATFKPTDNLEPFTLYISRITTGAVDLAGNALENDYVWSWTTGDEADTDRPTVLSTIPADLDINVPVNQVISAQFSEGMDPLTITNLTFMLTDGVNSIDGLISYDLSTDQWIFATMEDLAPDTDYTVTITTGVTDLAGNELAGDSALPLVANDHVWSFTTAIELVPLVDFGLAATFGISSTGGVTNTLTAPITHIDGDVVLNPNATCNGVEVDHVGGFGDCGGAAPTLNGEVITNQNPDTTTAQAVTDDLRAAYLSITPANMPGGTSIAAGTTLGEPEGAALVEGDNLFFPGVYTSNTSILITGDLTLDAQGDPNATFVFQSASTVGTSPNARILLVGEAKASNIFWQAGSAATLQTNTVWNGNVLAGDDVTMVTGATSCGRLFAGALTDGAFVFDSNVVSVPGHALAPTGCE